MGKVLGKRKPKKENKGVTKDHGNRKKAKKTAEQDVHQVTVLEPDVDIVPESAVSIELGELPSAMDQDVKTASDPASPVESVGETELITYKRPERIRHHWPGKDSLDDWTKLPPGWTAQEYDIDKNDIDAQIKRCEERIEDNIMTYLFKSRLERLKQKKMEKDAELEPYVKLGLPKIVCTRLVELEKIRKHLQKGDKLESLPNVEAIMKAYMEKKLEINGSVTYWSHGKQIGEQKEFDLEEFRKINYANEGYKGFWVEGLDEPGVPRRRNRKKTLMLPDPSKSGLYRFDISLRLGPDLGDGSQRHPGQVYPPQEVEFEFMDDTGASSMSIFRDDLEQLQGISYPRVTPWEQMIGFTSYQDAAQHLNHCPEFLLEVNMFTKPMGEPGRESMLNDWIPVRVGVDEENDSTGTDRLLGPVLRRMLYHGTAPEGSADRAMYISTHKSGLTELMPVITPQNKSQFLQEWPFQLKLHDTGAAWTYVDMVADPKLGYKRTKAVKALGAPVRLPGGKNKAPLPYAIPDPKDATVYTTFGAVIPDGGLPPFY